jgi:hypothetical protein
VVQLGVRLVRVDRAPCSCKVVWPWVRFMEHRWVTAKIFAGAVSNKLLGVGRVGSVYSGLLVNLLMCDRGGALYSVHITI